MVQIIEQREYIEKFLGFVKTFLIEEEVTIDELDLVESNLKLLLERIKQYKQSCKIGGRRVGTSFELN